MPQTIHVSDQIFAHLQSHATPFVDHPEDVIARALAALEREQRAGSPSKQTANAVSPIQHIRHEGHQIDARASRERGIRITLGGHFIDATTVRDLYEQALKIVVNEIPTNQLDALLPFATSSKRYLIAKKETHPNGTSFRQSIHFRGYYMEVHKDYKNAVSHLQKLAQKVGLLFKIRGNRGEE